MTGCPPSWPNSWTFSAYGLPQGGRKHLCVFMERKISFCIFTSSKVSHCLTCPRSPTKTGILLPDKLSSNSKCKCNGLFSNRNERWISPCFPAVSLMWTTFLVSDGKNTGKMKETANSFQPQMNERHDRFSSAILASPLDTSELKQHNKGTSRSIFTDVLGLGALSSSSYN